MDPTSFHHRLPESMRGKLLLLVVLVLAPLLVLQACIYAAWYYSHMATVKEATLREAMAVATAFETYVRDVHHDVLTAGTTFTDLRLHSPEEADAFLKLTTRDYPSIRSWNLTDLQGKIIASSRSNAVGLNIGDRDYFRRLLNGQDYAVSNVLLDRIDHTYTFVIACRVEDKNHALQGVAMAVVDVAGLKEYIASPHQHEKVAVKLFDQNGALVYDSADEYPLGTDMREEDSQLAAAIQSRASQQGIVRLLKYPERRIAARVSIGSLGWIAGASQPVAQAMEHVVSGLWLAGAMNLLVAIASGGAAWKTSTSLVRQLEQLRIHAHKIGQGDYAHTADQTGIAEIADLAAAFNRMGEAVQAAQQDRETAYFQLQTVFDIVNVGMLLIDEKGAVQRLNQTVSRWIGKDLSSLGGQQPGNVMGCAYIVGESRPCGHGSHCSRCVLRKTFESVLQSGEAVHDVETEVALAIADSTVRLWLEVSADPVELNGQRHVILALNNITARKAAENALRESQRDLNRAQAVARTGSWRLDVRQNKLLWSDENHRIFGVPKDTPMTYETFLAAAHPDDRPYVDQQWQAALHGQPYDIEHRILVNGAVRWVRERAELEFDESGAIRGGFGTTQDITDKKLTEEKLRQTTEKLARSNEELEQFAYIASHDLQEPLRAIIGYVQLLERRYKNQLDNDANEFIYYVVDGAARMQQLISDLLNYSRVGTRDVTFRSVDMQRVFDRVSSNLKTMIEETSATVSSDPLPAAWGDETQLVQLLQNLISNGIKFRGPRPPAIHVSASNDGDAVEFSIRDNGIGVDPQYWDQIFVIFQRLHTRKKYPGTGIGLSICKRIVERHGGRIWLDSQPDQGTTFHFTLPFPENRT